MKQWGSLAYNRLSILLPKFLYSTFLSMKTPSRNVFGLGSFSECSDDVRSTDLGRKGGWGIQPEINFLDQRTTAPSSRTRLSLRHLLFSAQRAKFPQDSEIRHLIQTSCWKTFFQQNSKVKLARWNFIKEITHHYVLVHLKISVF